MPDDATAQASTDRLLECVGHLFAESEIEGRLPTRAIIVFESLDMDGDPSIDYVATKGMSLTDVMGFGHFLRSSAVADLFYADDDE